MPRTPELETMMKRLDELILEYIKADELLAEKYEVLKKQRWMMLKRFVDNIRETVFKANETELIDLIW